MEEKMQIVLNSLIEATKRNFKNDGFLTPVVIFIDSEYNIQIMLAEFSNQQEKVEFAKKIKDLCHQFNSQAVYIAFESLSYSTENKKELERILKEREIKGSLEGIKGVKDIVSIIFETKVDNRTIIFDIDKNKNELINQKESKEVYGLFSGMVKKFNYN